MIGQSLTMFDICSLLEKGVAFYEIEPTRLVLKSLKCGREYLLGYKMGFIGMIRISCECLKLLSVVRDWVCFQTPPKVY